MSLNSRKIKRDAALSGAEIAMRDAKNRAILVTVPSLSEDTKLYSVTLGRTKAGLHVSCKCGGQVCQGNSHHTVCYHCQSAVMLAAQEQAGHVSWCENESDAIRLNNLHHGKIVTVHSLQGNGKAWVVFYN